MFYFCGAVLSPPKLRGLACRVLLPILKGVTNSLGKEELKLTEKENEAAKISFNPRTFQVARSLVVVGCFLLDLLIFGGPVFISFASFFSFLAGIAMRCNLSRCALFRSGGLEMDIHFSHSPGPGVTSDKRTQRPFHSIPRIGFVCHFALCFLASCLDGTIEKRSVG